METPQERRRASATGGKVGFELAIDGNPLYVFANLAGTSDARARVFVRTNIDFQYRRIFFLGDRLGLSAGSGTGRIRAHTHAHQDTRAHSHTQIQEKTQACIQHCRDQGRTRS